MMKFRNKAFKLFLVLTIVLTFLVIPTFAEVLGGKWVNNPTFYLATNSQYYQPYLTAVNVWNINLTNTGTSIRIRSNSQSAATISPSEGLYGYTGWSANCAPGPNLHSGTYTYAEMKLNTSYMWKYSPEKKSAVIAHELGHMLGIDHTQSTTPRSLMYEAGSSVYYDQWLLTGPTSFDYNTLNSIY